MKIVIDTNILYSWVKIFENSKFNSEQIDRLAKENELFITTTSILEFIVKFRQDLENLKKCINPLINQRLTIISIGFTPVSNDDIWKIYYSCRIEECKEVIEQLFKLKVQKETEFLRFYFIVLITGSIDLLLKESDFIPGTPQYNSLSFQSLALLNGNVDFLYHDLYNNLINGYKENKIDPIIKKYFSDMLYLFLYAWKGTINLVKNNSSIMDFSKLNSVTIEKIVEETKGDEIVNKMKDALEKNISTLSIFNNRTYRDSIENFLVGLGDHLTNDDRFTDLVIEYLSIKIKRYFTTSKKMVKNDALDMLLLYPLLLEDNLLLTLDEDFKNILEVVHPKSFQLINSLIL